MRSVTSLNNQLRNAGRLWSGSTSTLNCNVFLKASSPVHESDRSKLILSVGALASLIAADSRTQKETIGLSVSLDVVVPSWISQA